MNKNLGEFYRHYKGNVYRITGIGKHTETGYVEYFYGGNAD
jgi:hypothetical protein